MCETDAMTAILEAFAKAALEHLLHGSSQYHEDAPP
jgi:hypothetical protein